MERFAALLTSIALVACDDAAKSHSVDGGPIAEDGGPDRQLDAGGAIPDAGPIPDGATRFVLRIENLASPALPTELGAGLAVLHAEPDPLFTEGVPDRASGLEALAEDGDPTALADALDGTTFAAIAPGEHRDIVIDATPARSRLSFATMLAESNDVFLAPEGAGVALFDEAGRPLPARDVTEHVFLWNAGTEIDQAPGLGPMQAARQPAPGSGDPETRIRAWSDATRTLPLARDLAHIAVRVDGSRVAIAFENVSRDRGLLVTSLSPLVWALHDGTLQWFEEGAPAIGNGLEALAEESNADAISMWADAHDAVSAAGVANQPAGRANPGIVHPGEGFEVVLEPDVAHPFLTVISRIVSSNDAFLAFPGEGVRLLDDRGVPRASADIERDILRSLAVWDAGTEANEVPGAGAHTASHAGDAGAPDPDRRVRRYSDVTNDLSPDRLATIVRVDIRHVSDTTFEVTIENTSGSSPFTMLFTPFLYALHTDEARLFDPEIGPSPGLVALAEDCFTNVMYAELSATEGFAGTALAALPVGEAAPGPLRDDERYTFTVTAHNRYRRLSIASMPYPSNDMLLAFGPEGIELLDASGAPRSEDAIMADVRASFRAWDAGSESNQAGGGGRDAVPLQEVPDVGEREGDGTVRRRADPVWSYPEPSELVRVTIVPAS